MKKSEIEAQAMVTLDAIEAEDPRVPKLVAPILKVVRAHGVHEGRADYEGRARAVAAGHEDSEWAWPFDGADDYRAQEYLRAVGSSEITREIGIPARLWDHVSDAWLDAFKRGYVAAHEADKTTKKSVAQLDREIAKALSAGSSYSTTSTVRSTRKATRGRKRRT